MKERLRMLTIGAIMLAFVSFCASEVRAQEAPQWITWSENDSTSQENIWIAFRKEANLESLDSSHMVRIGGDTKYWLWINGELVLREGGLKWGPTHDSYYEDELDIGGYLKKGVNSISIALWHFGKNGFAHKDSGLPAIKLSDSSGLFSTDTSWQAERLKCFRAHSEAPYPNWRLAESNVNFDASLCASKDIGAPLFGFQMSQNTDAKAVDVDYRSVLREIPQWKDYGLKNYKDLLKFPLVSTGDTVIMDLPYNMQVTPYFEINSPSGLEVDIRMDNYKGGSEYNVRTVYKTSQGHQAFETPAWMNGHSVRYYFPADITINNLGYRESGYETEFSGEFVCDSPPLNTLWEKSARTLYITMRDNFMDCPDRERAQWWGDAVIQSGQCSYAFDRQSDLLTKKAILELMNWQRSDSTIYSPVPAGNWDQELPTQMLASVGHYGIWNYYKHTGDRETLEAVYPKIKAYLAVWKQSESGLVVRRNGGWTWGDWGTEKDMELIFNGWYALALKGAANMAAVLGEYEERDRYLAKMELVKKAWNSQFWTGSAYRSPDYSGETDERGQALALLAGFVDEDKYSALAKTILEGEHCSPYFEKYVYEALFKMGYASEALERMMKRYETMINSPISTLWEGWEVGSATWGGGTYNHSWSGGPLTIMSQYVLGVEPLTPGYNSVRIRPQLGSLKSVSGKVMTPLGLLTVAVFLENGELKVEYTKPENMEVTVLLD